ncbi:myoneurin-like isoform X2 [Pangasianodon hypophthalmus]|uniref:myoneurin-like isoform X2 n=1 Tax=Pangasianodon hypophthalmus TaxID=310915 RepID=UPI002306F8F0|nr:myoneurin-like isoform X2 [Pangasianodon hypophthalmus]
MDIKTEPITKPSHGFALLKELDLQRRTGAFCDCVIRLHVHPDKLFLAHKSVLAAFSPVFATLLPQHGSFLDFTSPLLTPETLALLLEYMYTGTLPPKSHEEPVLYAAFHLQMEQLQHALTHRRNEKEITDTVQDQTNRKRGFTEHEALSASSYFPYGSDQPPPSTPSYEAVPVIRHLKTTGNNNLPLQNHCLDKTLDVEHVSEANKHPQSSQDNNLLLDSFFESSQSKHDKTENSVNDISDVVAEEVEKFNSFCKIGQFQSNGSHTIAALRSNTYNKDQCVHSADTRPKHLSPDPDCRISANICVSDVDSVQSLNPSESERHVQVPGILSNTFSDKKSYNTTDNNSENTSHAGSQQMAGTCKRQDNLYLENSSSSDTNSTICEKGTSDLNEWHKMGQYYAPTSEMVTVEKVVLGEESQKNSHTNCCDFSKLRKDCVNQGHLRYHCLPESNDSDSDETSPGSNVDVKDSSEVLETIDVTEILCSTREQLKSGSLTYSKTRQFQCSVPECEKAFSQRGSLNRHMRSHLGIRPYSCPLCTMTFSRQYRVNEHMRVHQRSCEDPP